MLIGGLTDWSVDVTRVWIDVAFRLPLWSYVEYAANSGLRWWTAEEGGGGAGGFGRRETAKAVELVGMNGTGILSHHANSKERDGERRIVDARAGTVVAFQKSQSAIYDFSGGPFNATM